MRRTLVPEAVRALALILTLATPGAVLAAPPGPAPLRPLDERTLGIGESHDYYFPMKKGEYLRIDVEQNDDIDAGIRLFDSTGKLLLHANSYTGTHGAETLSWIAEREEVLWVQVYNWDPDRLGSFEARVDGPREPSIADSRRTAATTALFEGIRLEEAGLWWLAADRHKQAAGIFSSLAEPRWEAIAQRHQANALYERGFTSEGIKLFRSAWEALVHFEESSLLVQAGLYIARSLFKEPQLAEDYLSVAIRNLPILPLEVAAGEASNLAVAAEKLGYFETATSLLRYEVNLRRGFSNSAELSQALGSLSRMLRRLGRIVEARKLAEKQVRLAKAPADQARARIGLALISIAQQDPHEAIEILRPLLSLTLPEDLAADLFYAMGWSEFEAGEYLTAYDHFKLAAATHQGGKRACDLAFLSLIETASDRVSRGKMYLDEARRADPSMSQEVQAFLSKAEAEIAVREGRHLDALRSLDNIFNDLSSQRESNHAESLRASYWSTKVTYVEFAIDLLLRIRAASPDQIYLEKAFIYLEKSRAPTLVEHLSHSSRLEPDKDNRILEQGLKKIDDQLAQVQYRRPARWRQKETALLNQREELVLSHRVGDPLRRERNRRARESQFGMAELRNQLSPDEQLLSFFLGSKRSYAFLVGRHGIDLALLPDRRTLEATVLRAVTVLKQSRGANSRGDEQLAAQDLSRILLAPLIDKLRANRLLLVLDGGLHRIPFAAVANPANPVEPLIERYELAIVPSLTSLALSRDKGRQCVGTAVVFGQDPLISAPLDLEAVRKADPGAVHLEPAREQLLGGALEPYCNIHFATHSISDQQWPDTATLLLDRGPNTPLQRIYAFEIQSLRISSELVVLAACESGVGDIRGEGLFGLPRAFLAAGARRVVASLWPVDGRTTAELMDDFYSHIARNQAPSTALREAQRAMRSRPGRSSPRYWAGFQLIGDPGKTSN